jgi:lipopolysaccharide transport system ATP-binding protein
MAARLGFSVAIHVDPAVLIVDEALAVGDARFVAKCMRKVKDIQANGSTIIFVSHDVSSVRTLCQRAFWLDKGRLVDEGDVFPVTGRYMAFMMRDDKASDDAVRDEVAQPVPAPAEPASAGAWPRPPGWTPAPSPTGDRTRA